MKLFIAAAVAAAVGVAAGVVCGLSSCSSPPATAASILRADGYTVTVNPSTSSSPYFSSEAAGTDGTDIQVVVIFKPSAASLESGVESELFTDYPGLDITTNGDVMVITGTEAELGTFNGSGL